MGCLSGCRLAVAFAAVLASGIGVWSATGWGDVRAEVRSRTMVFRQSSDLSVGDKGEEAIDVSRPAPVCGRASAVFDGARIEYRRRRFGEAMIVASPPAGCTRCPPLRVRWFHEPTGYLDFTVTAQWRQVVGRCDGQQR